MKKTTVMAMPLALALASVTGLAHAQAAATDSGWYGGLNVGQSRASIDEDRIANSLLAGGFTQSAIRKDTRDLGFKVFGGYQFNRYLALESGYFDLGKFGFDATTQPNGTLQGNARFKGVALDAVGFLPLTDKLSAFGRAGVNYAETKNSFRGSGAVQVADPHRSDRATNYKAGVGLQYAVTPTLGLRAEVERYRVKDGVGNRGDIDLASVGLVYRFKSAAPIVAVSEPMPEIAAAAPPPPPPVVPEPVFKAITLSADSLFDFDRATVKPAGQQALDQLAAELKGNRYERISVIGHTDFLGPEPYNLELSARRAEAVKQYLVETAGLPAEKIIATGVNGSEPVTARGDCASQHGTTRSAELVACLQPDRRVEVRVQLTP